MPSLTTPIGCCMEEPKRGARAHVAQLAATTEQIDTLVVVQHEV